MSATLHIFNPGHDIALAANLENFTPPKAARDLQRRLGGLPALWAQPGDVVLVDDAAFVDDGGLFDVRDGVSFPRNDVFFLTAKALAADVEQRRRIDRVEPWGWDRAVAGLLKRVHLSHLAPSDEWLQTIRLMSHRRFAATRFLPFLTDASWLSTAVSSAAEETGRCPSSSLLVGEATELSSPDAFTTEQMQKRFPKASAFVAKSPWSSTGRGVRFLQTPADWQRQQAWARRVIAQQGSVMLEPLYPRVMDFAMEFQHGRYCGLSLFDTRHGAYTGNRVASEEAKMEVLTSYLPASLLQTVRMAIEYLAEKEILPFYKGPFGVDMMVVDGGCETQHPYQLHPCVELNLRRTMGHVALVSRPCESLHFGL